MKIKIIRPILYGLCGLFAVVFSSAPRSVSAQEIIEYGFHPGYEKAIGAMLDGSGVAVKGATDATGGTSIILIIAAGAPNVKNSLQVNGAIAVPLIVGDNVYTLTTDGLGGVTLGNPTKCTPDTCP